MKKIESTFRIEFDDEMVLQALILCFECWLSVVEILILMVNNNSTGATTVLDLTWNFRIPRDPESQGIPDGSLGSTGVWDPSRAGNESQTRFPENEFWDSDLSGTAAGVLEG